MTDLFAELGERFERADRKLFLVGGSVRDMVLGREAKDLDFTTDALPDEIEGILKDWADSIWDVGREFGTIAAKKGDDDIEITTFRFDGPGRKPQVTFTDSLDEDLARRDFTINAMALEVTIRGLDGMNADGRPNGSFGFINRNNLIDPFGGFQHLCSGTLDTPNLPGITFSEDPLRMLRAARFSSQLNFTVHRRVEQAMKTEAALLNTISAERIAAEMDKLLMGMMPEKGLRLLVNTRLKEFIVPELIWRDPILIGDDVETRWADLLSDIDPLEVEVRLRKLKFSNERVRAVTDLVKLRNQFAHVRWGEAFYGDSEVRKVLAAAGPQFLRLVKLLRASDTLLPLATKLLAKEGFPEPFLTGDDVMAVLDIKPGPRVGEALAHLWDIRLQAGPLDRSNVIKLLLAWDKVSA